MNPAERLHHETARRGRAHGGSGTHRRQAPRAGAEPLVDLAAERHQPLPRARPGPLAADRPQPGRVPQADRRPISSSGGPPRWRSTRGSTTPSGGWPNTSRTPTPGARSTPRACGRGRSPTSRRSSACTRACRSTRAAWACWPATTSRAPATWASRWSASACSTPRATSASRSTPTAGSRRTTSTPTPTCCRSSRCSATDGKPLLIAIDTNVGVLHARVWRVEVGRTTLCLLDSNVPENSEIDRALTARLYGGDARVRIRQELLLGVGGVRALHALGIHPSVLHLNEGHSAFAGLEMIRARDGVERACPSARPCATSPAMTVFTTHTPVAAGHDRFPAPLVEEHLGKIREAIHLSYDDFMGLGRVYPGDHNEPFCMTVLALKLSRHANGVSALHGQVSRRMWQPLYPEPHRGRGADRAHHQRRPRPDLARPADAPALRPPPRPRLAERTAAPRDLGRASSTIDDAELWETQQVLKARLIDFVRRRLVAQAQRRDEGDAAVAAAPEGARPERPDDRLRPPVRHLQAGRPGPPRRRAAGRAGQRGRPPDPVRLRRQGPPRGPLRQGADPEHRPADPPGPAFAHRIVFVEDYDMNVARHLVQGVDVWLNNPRRPQEASGTSGEKVLLNGGLNLLDPRRLVGRGLRRHQRLRHRRAARPTPIPSRAGRARPRGPDATR